jgi:tetratricopeptide (TPR) repeat protein
MKHIMNLDRLEEFVCLEPEAGAELLPLYPEFLSGDDKVRFELHREGCEYCQEHWNLWRVTGLALRATAIMQRANEFLQERRYEEAIQEYNRAVALAPNVLATQAAQEFFQADTWLSLTAARMGKKDVMPYVAPSYEPGRYQLAAADSSATFPIDVEYAEGNVQGKFSVAGRLVFFELVKAEQEFTNGITLVGQVGQGARALLKIWNIVPGKRQRLDTLTNLFGEADFPDIIQELRSFKVVPLASA